MLALKRTKNLEKSFFFVKKYYFFIFFIIYILLCQNIVGNKNFSLGSFPEVGQKQKTEKKKERKKRERLNDGNNNGLLRIATWAKKEIYHRKYD